jgi:hypothetical protein
MLACMAGDKVAPKIKREIALDCISTTAIPADVLRPIVKQVMSQVLQHPATAMWGDKAFSVDLDGDGQVDYVMPLECSDSGNCIWGLFLGTPARLVAKIDASRIFVQQVETGWAPLTTYQGQGPESGVVSRLAFTSGSYRYMSTRLISGRTIKRFLASMHQPGCGDTSTGAT